MSVYDRLGVDVFHAPHWLVSVAEGRRHSRVCMALGLCARTEGDPSESGLVDPLHHPVAGHTQHEPTRIHSAHSQVSIDASTKHPCRK